MYMDAHVPVQVCMYVYVCMHACMYIHTHTHLYAHTRTHAHTHMTTDFSEKFWQQWAKHRRRTGTSSLALWYVSVFVCMWVLCMCVCMYVCVCTSSLALWYVPVYVCMYLCVCMYVCMDVWTIQCMHARAAVHAWVRGAGACGRKRPTCALCMCVYVCVCIYMYTCLAYWHTTPYEFRSTAYKRPTSTPCPRILEHRTILLPHYTI
jgi:hypothetical protein